MVNRVETSKRVEKELEKIPPMIRMKLEAWIFHIVNKGWERVKMYPGYHDEMLQGKRWGQRSARLNRSYRIIYSVQKDSDGSYIYVEEVTKHEY